jgi:hypothetical protein
MLLLPLWRPLLLLPLLIDIFEISPLLPAAPTVTAARSLAVN